MTQYCKINGKVVAQNDGKVDIGLIERFLSNDSYIVVADDSVFGPDDQEVDLADVAQRLRAVGDELNRQFIEVDNMIEAFLIALVANEHVFVKSPPGMAKTAVMSALTKAIQCSIWRTLFNPDLTRDSLLGTIDPTSLETGKWQRNWSSLATHDVAVLDEVWKGSGQNNNILLDALEERRVREGDDEQDIPLITALGASNEFPTDSERQAIYDRFLLRLTMDYTRDADNFWSIMTADAGTTPVAQTVNADELRMMGAASEFLALNPNDDIKEVVMSLWREMNQNGHAVSHRRWRRSLKAVMAYALLLGQDPGQVHCKALRFTLWADEDDESDVHNLVMSKSDPFAGRILDIDALMSELRRDRDTILSREWGDDEGDELSAAKINFSGREKCGKLLKKISDLSKIPGNEHLHDDLDKFEQEVTDMQKEVLQVF